MCPTSVSMPVAMTRARPEPPAMLVPRKTMFWRSASGVSGAQRPGCFSTGGDSPVKCLVQVDDHHDAGFHRDPEQSDIADQTATLKL